MTSGIVQSGSAAPQQYRSGQQYRPGWQGSHEPAGLADILERVLDKGLVIAGDIRINLLDIELLTIKLRLVIASLDTAREVGINWWESDPWLNADAQREERLASKHDQDLSAENQRLRERIEALEAGSADGRDESRGAAEGRERS